MKEDDGPISDVMSTKATDVHARARDAETVAGPILSGASDEISAKA